MNTVFISILIEALPFVLIGAFIASLIQIFVSEEMVAKLMPKNRFLAIGYGLILGCLFPACECGIVPIVRRLTQKGVPLYAGIAFMLTGPIVNPIVLFSTYIAFGSSFRMVIYRGVLAIVVAFIVSLILSFMFKDNQLLEPVSSNATPPNKSWRSKISGVFTHTIEEFFSMGKYLIIGSLIAAAVQTYVKTATLVEIGQGPITSILVMMLLAFVLNLCSEADAFIASSFQTTFPASALTAFLVFGAMVDIKNLLMMFASFKKKFVLVLISLCFIFVFVGSLCITIL